MAELFVTGTIVGRGCVGTVGRSKEYVIETCSEIHILTQQLN